jgi:hypothetical protein
MRSEGRRSNSGLIDLIGGKSSVPYAHEGVFAMYIGLGGLVIIILIILLLT